MRPPAQRHAPKGEIQIRPNFEASLTLQSTTGYKKSVFNCPQNEDSPMKRACHRPHELVVLPLLSDLRYREAGMRALPALQGGANVPHLAKKSHPRQQHIVSTYN